MDAFTRGAFTKMIWMLQERIELETTEYNKKYQRHEAEKNEYIQKL